MSHLKYHNKLIELSNVFYESHCELITSICMELEQPDKIKELQAKFLDKIKLKAKVDPERPKKAKTSYMYFCQAERENILKDNPNILLGEQSKKLGEKWSSLDSENKQKFIDKAEEDKSRYEEELEDYNEKWSVD